MGAERMRPLSGTVSCVATALVLAATSAVAQGEAERRALTRGDYTLLVRQEQEPSNASLPFLAFGMPREEHEGEQLRLLYEATIAPPFFISIGRRPLLIAFTPKVILRQCYRGSYPVPPPSYMPRATLYYWGWPYQPRTHVDSAVYAFLRLAHHSNGQVGPFYTPAGPPNINYRDGDFATDYVEVGLVQRALAGGRTGSRQISFEWHPNGWMVKALRPIYGPYRVHLRSRIAIPRVRVSGIEAMDLGLSYIAGPVLPDRRDALDRAVFTYTIYSDVGRVGDFLPFVSYYTGQDYYNIRFDRNISVLKVGAVAGFRRQAPASPPE